MSTLDDLMEGYYQNDLTNKENKTFEVKQVLAFEMRPELTTIMKKYGNIKTGFKCDRFPNGNLNLRSRTYWIYYKK